MGKVWNITVRIEGTAFGSVEANTKEEAIQKATEGDWLDTFEIEEWEFNTEGYKGGWIEAREEK